MAFESLASDFYGFESLLTEREREFIANLRAAMLVRQSARGRQIHSTAA